MPCHVEHAWSKDEYYCRLYWARALIRQYLTTGRKHAFIKEYALNKHVRLLTRLYSIAYDYVTSSTITCAIQHWVVLCQHAPIAKKLICQCADESVVLLDLWLTTHSLRVEKKPFLSLLSIGCSRERERRRSPANNTRTLEQSIFSESHTI